MIFGIVSARAGPHWQLKDDEAERLAYRIARVDIKWGGFLDKYGEEIMLVGCLAAIGWPRVQEDIRRAREGEDKTIDGKGKVTPEETPDLTEDLQNGASEN